MRKHQVLIAIAMAMGMAGSGTTVAAPQIEIGGVVEVEAVSGDGDSDIVVATVELGLAAQINERASAEIVLLYEEDDAPVGVDSAIINVEMSDRVSVVAGQSFIPFGRFESNMVSDPLTLEIAETSASLMQLDYTVDALGLSFYAFNGAQAGDEIDNYGINVALAGERFAVALGYLANIGDTDTIAADTIDSAVPGMSIGARYNVGGFTLLAEHIAAVSEFKSTDGNSDLTTGYNFNAGDKPSSTIFELAYTIGETTIAIGTQRTTEAAVLGLPEQRTVVAISTAWMENTSVAMEYASDEPYAGDSIRTVTAQLAVEF